MVLRLGATLDVSLRHTNEMLRAAGHEAVYPEPSIEQGLPDEVAHALGLMKTHHEPFPLLVMNRAYDLLDLNAGALALFRAAMPQSDITSDAPMNLARLTFDPRGAQPAIANFDEVGSALLWRIQREVLAEPDDGPLRVLLEDLLAMPSVDEHWRDADLSIPSSASVGVSLHVGDDVLHFMTMMTALQAPQTVALDELRIETWFPTGTATADACRALGA